MTSRFCFRKCIEYIVQAICFLFTFKLKWAIWPNTYHMIKTGRASRQFRTAAHIWSWFPAFWLDEYT